MTIDEPDAGIWEFRNRAGQHAYTNLFQWAGCQAAMRIARKLGNRKLAARAEKLSRQAGAYIEKCYSKQHKAYFQGVGNNHMDASTLQLIIMGYIPNGSKKAKDHLKALETDLKAGKGLFYRYIDEDDFGKPETTFLICGFWYAEALACMGRVDEAMEAMEELISYGNHLGLLSEDAHASNGSMWGNFPQAYSHVGLVNAAARINNHRNMPGFLS
jgi:GH15 family glucan-1,4-alpha-glucosidase